MARKAVLMALECPNCGAKGAAKCGENGTPLRSTQALDRELRRRGVHYPGERLKSPAGE